MQLCSLILRLLELQEEIGPYVQVDLMQEGTNIQLQSEVQDIATSRGKIIIIGNELE